LDRQLRILAVENQRLDLAAIFTTMRIISLPRREIDQQLVVDARGGRQASRALISWKILLSALASCQ
jgi:hypothetical protein